MHHRLGYVSLTVAGVSLAVATAIAQAPAPRSVPRTPWGDPDLQGLWTNATVTPFERPANLSGKAVLTQEEAAEFERQTNQARDADNRGGGTEADLGRAYNQFWFERGTKVVGTRRTSLVTDPPDGRVPALTPAAQSRADARAEARRRSPADGPEDRSLVERCIVWPTAGPPMVPGAYNNNYQILQAPGHVAILIEMIHDVRIIPLDGRPHAPQAIRQWMGDSRGRWDGNTLIVTTTNFTDKTIFRGSSANLKIVERFTRVDPDTLDYQFSIDDPESFTRSWTAAVPMTKTDGPIFEYACHEGNYGMTNLLKGARAEDK
ncbi:MAG TPA: hypothetical protein VL914_07620 [Vicinamibacterales bacterium]|nr:hypothetical protein [Vicinamibacterales bacterium]